MFKEKIEIPDGEYFLLPQEIKISPKPNEKIFKTPEGGDILFLINKDYDSLSFLEEGASLNKDNIENYLYQRGSIITLILVAKSKSYISEGDFYFDGFNIKQSKSAKTTRIESLVLPLFYIIQHFPNLFFDLKNGRYCLGDTFWYKNNKFYDKHSIINDISFRQSKEILENVKELLPLLPIYCEKFKAIIKEESEGLGFTFELGKEKNTYIIYNKFLSFILIFDIDTKKGFLTFNIFNFVSHQFPTTNAFLSLSYKKEDIEAKLFKNHF